MTTDINHCDRCGINLDCGASQDIDAKTGEVLRSYCYNCRFIQQLDQFQSDRVLTTSLVERCELEVYVLNNEFGRRRESIVERNPHLRPLIDRVVICSDRILAEVRNFQRDVWQQGLSDIVDNCAERGTSVVAGPLSMMTFELAARIMITVKVNEYPYVSMLTYCKSEREAFMKLDRDRSEPFAFRGIGATEEQALQLLGSARLLWAHGWRPVPDSDVTLDVIAVMRGNSPKETAP